MSLFPDEFILNRIDSIITKNMDHIIRDAIDLINIPSVSTNKKKIDEAMNFILQKGKEYGFNSYEVLDGQVGLIEFGEGDETVGILAHIDVVDAEGAWKFAPFKATLFEDQIWGRGAIDDKGPLIASLHAMKSIKELNLPVHKKIQLIIGTQEEVEWTDMKEYAKYYKLPDYGFTPDGEFPIENREKGYIDVTVSFEKLEIESEDAYKILSIKGGQSVNSIPSWGEALIQGDLDVLEKIVAQYMIDDPNEKISFTRQGNLGVITAEGFTVHSAYPEKGINALIVLCEFLESLSIAPNGADRLVKFIMDNFKNDCNGKKLGLYNENEYINGEYISRTVISPTLLETGDKGFNLNLNIRTAYGITKDDLDRRLDKAALEYDYSYVYRDYMGPIYVSKDRPFVQAMVDSYEEVSGLKSEFVLAHGTSYAKAMPNILCFGPIFPGEYDFCHEKDERITLETLIKSTKIYAHTIARIVLNTASFK